MIIVIVDVDAIVIVINAIVIIIVVLTITAIITVVAIVADNIIVIIVIDGGTVINYALIIAILGRTWTICITIAPACNCSSVTAVANTI